MDASLKGLHAVLSQKHDSGKACIIAYASRMLQPPEWFMHNYSSDNLKLLALKWFLQETPGLFAGVKI